MRPFVALARKARPSAVRFLSIMEALGSSPSLWEAIAYSLVAPSISGVFFGVIRVRTKDLLALMMIQAAEDLLPTLAEFLKIWDIR